MRRVLPVLILALGLAAPAHAQTVEEGYAAYDAGDYAKARTILLPLAEAGDPKAMNRIGLMYDFGKGFPKNPTLGCDWYEKAANAGYARAQSNLSLCYKEGSGRPKDIDLDIHWNEMAAEQGDLDCQIDLIKLYHKRNPERARYWGQKTADRNSVIGRLVMDGLGIPYTGPKPSRLESYCFLVMIDFFGKKDDYCDGITIFSFSLRR
jgi:TPR repeat protein